MLSGEKLVFPRAQEEPPVFCGNALSAAFLSAITASNLQVLVLFYRYSPVCTYV